MEEADIDLSSFPIIRLDQISLIDTDTLIKINTESEQLINEILNESNFSSSEPKPALVEYLEKQMTKVTSELNNRQSNDSNYSIFHHLTSRNDDNKLRPDQFNSMVDSSKPTVFTPLPLPSELRSKGNNGNYESKFNHEEREIIVDTIPHKPSRKRRESQGQRKVNENENIEVKRHSFSSHSASSTPNNKGLNEMNKNFGNVFMVAATEKKLRFFPKKKPAFETIEELRTQDRLDRRKNAMRRLLERRQKREENQINRKQQKRLDKIARKKTSIDNSSSVNSRERYHETNALGSYSSSESESVSGGSDDDINIEDIKVDQHTIKSMEETILDFQSQQQSEIVQSPISESTSVPNISSAKLENHRLDIETSEVELLSGSSSFKRLIQTNNLPPLSKEAQDYYNQYHKDYYSDDDTHYVDEYTMNPGTKSHNDDHEENSIEKADSSSDDEIHHAQYIESESDVFSNSSMPEQQSRKLVLTHESLQTAAISTVAQCDGVNSDILTDLSSRQLNKSNENSIVYNLFDSIETADTSHHHHPLNHRDRKGSDCNSAIIRSSQLDFHALAHDTNHRSSILPHSTIDNSSQHSGSIYDLSLDDLPKDPARSFEFNRDQSNSQVNESFDSSNATSNLNDNHKLELNSQFPENRRKSIVCESNEQEISNTAKDAIYVVDDSVKSSHTEKALSHLKSSIENVSTEWVLDNILVNDNGNDNDAIHSSVSNVVSEQQNDSHAELDDKLMSQTTKSVNLVVNEDLRQSKLLIPPKKDFPLKTRCSVSSSNNSLSNAYPHFGLIFSISYLNVLSSATSSYSDFHSNNSIVPSIASGSAKQLVEMMHIQYARYQEWLDIMGDYATVFSEDRGFPSLIESNAANRLADSSHHVYSGSANALHYRVNSSTRPEVSNIINDVLNKLSNETSSAYKYSNDTQNAQHDDRSRIQSTVAVSDRYQDNDKHVDHHLDNHLSNLADDNHMSEHSASGQEATVHKTSSNITIDVNIVSNAVGSLTSRSECKPRRQSIFQPSHDAPLSNVNTESSSQHNIDSVVVPSNHWQELPTGLGLGLTWNLLWTWSKPHINQSQLLVWQKINHFENSKFLTRKDLLKKSLQRFLDLCRDVGSKVSVKTVNADNKELSSGNKLASYFDIMPQTFLLPNEYTQFIAAFTSNEMKVRNSYTASAAELMGNDVPTNMSASASIDKSHDNGSSPTDTSTSINPLNQWKSNNYWIMKPVGLSRGRGISVIKDLSSITYSQASVIQQYIDNPLCLNGYKFDLRLYVLVTSFQPLEAWIYRDGFARLSTLLYSNDDISNKLIHLTNSSIQKYNTEGISKDNPLRQSNKVETGGSKLSLLGPNGLWSKLKSVNPQFNMESLWSKICLIIVKSLIAANDKISYQPNCFEVFGYDVIIDQSFTPWLLEVNSSPSLARENSLDSRIKEAMVRDTILLVNPPAFDRQELVNVLKRRLNCGKSSNPKEISKELGRKERNNLEHDLRLILGPDYIPRGYGEMPAYLGNYEQLCPNTKHYDAVNKLKQKLVKPI